MNEHLQLKKKSYRVMYVLPSKEDYDKALPNAFISNDSLFMTYTTYKRKDNIRVKKNEFMGVTDNVPEYTDNEKIIVTGGDAAKIETAHTTPEPIGFRCKAIIVKE